MPSAAEIKEKKAYWERRVWDLLRQSPLEDILIMSWALEAIRTERSQYSQRLLPFPGDPRDHKIGKPFFIAPWNIDAIINEKLVLPSYAAQRQLNLRAWPGVVKLMNTYNGLANVDGHTDILPGGIIAALPRLFWPQYNWQLGYDNNMRIGRAWHVYATPQGKSAFLRKHSVELEDFLKVSFTAYVATMAHPAVKISYFDALGLSRATVLNCLSIISASLSEQANFAKEIRNDRLPRDFKRSVVKERPLFWDVSNRERRYYVPSREMLLLRITDGLYYDIVSDDDARRTSGEYFEDLAYQALKHYSDTTETVERDKPTPYGRSADLFITDNDGENGLIVECKTRRIPQRVLSSPNPWEDCKDDFDDIIKGIVQIWRTHLALYAGGRRDMVGMVLQYEPWTIMGNAFIQQLFDAAHRMAQRLSIPESSRIPVALVGYPDFENCLRFYNLSAIISGVRMSAEERFHGYQLSGVVSEYSERMKKKLVLNYPAIASAAVPWWSS